MSLPVPSKQTRLTHPKYRPDIDGLRAIAVLAVVGFHTFPNWIKGGFIGVDVFFIISGYLITSIILSSLDKGTFTFNEFYARRIKRIFPALIVVMTACFTLGWFALFPDEYEQLGKHIAAGAGFVSNLFFWQEAGYFDNLAVTKPLLHLWSLGVEEQYYIFWPLLLYLAWKQHFKFLIFAGLIAITSFLFGIYILHSDPVQAFYSPLTRFWELMMGSLYAYLTLHRISPISKLLHMQSALFGKPNAADWAGRFWTRHLQSLIGALLIGLAVLVVSKARAFPGYWALLPTIGAYLVISAGQHAWLNQTLLSHRVFVWFGLISYPLYLWHWPLLSFARIIIGYTPAWPIRVLILLTSIVLAWLTYRLIESPIRFSSHSQVSTIASFILMIIVGFCGYLSYINHGLEHRRIAENKKQMLNDVRWDRREDKATNEKFHCPAEIKKSLPFLTFCNTSAVNAPSAAVIGDSHANHLFPGIPNNDKLNRWILLGIHSCPPTIGIIAKGSNPGCAKKFDGLFKYLIRDNDIKLVVLSFFGEYAADTYYNANAVQRYGKGKNHYILKSGHSSSRIETLYYGLDNSIKLLLSSGKKVIVSLDVPELPFFPRDCIRISTKNISDRCSIPRLDMEHRQTTIRKIVTRLKKANPTILVYDPIDLFCTKEKCYVFRNGRSYYRDSHHLSVFGSNIVGRDFIKWLSNQSINVRPTEIGRDKLLQ